MLYILETPVVYDPAMVHDLLLAKRRKQYAPLPILTPSTTAFGKRRSRSSYVSDIMNCGNGKGTNTKNKFSGWYSVL